MPVSQQDRSDAQRASWPHFDEQAVLNKLKRYLPSQAPLHNFVHHNALQAFQHLPFHLGLQMASTIFGYTTYLPLDEYRNRYQSGKISAQVLDKIICEKKGAANLETWKNKLLTQQYTVLLEARVGRLRSKWMTTYKVNPNKEVHPLLFRMVGRYLDQGISIHRFPVLGQGFLGSVRELEQNSFVSLFQSKKVKQLLLDTPCELSQLLQRVVGDEQLFEQYLFDQQFSHPGWSGMVSVLEDKPQTLPDRRTISLRDFIALELLLELDMLGFKRGESWLPLGKATCSQPVNLFAPVGCEEKFDVYALWQEAFEWTCYNQLLSGLQAAENTSMDPKLVSMQAVFCHQKNASITKPALPDSTSRWPVLQRIGLRSLANLFSRITNVFDLISSTPLDYAKGQLSPENKVRHQQNLDIFAQYTYDYRNDPDGKKLLEVLRSVGPVCGGINLDYYFSRVDPHHLGSGSELMHDVIGLIGVANGMDSDLRTGLSNQMVRNHDPVRLMVIVEQRPDLVLQLIQKEAATYEWFINEWIHLVVIHPETKGIYRFRQGAFTLLYALATEQDKLTTTKNMVEPATENLPILFPP